MRGPEAAHRLDARARPGGERMFQLLISLIGAIIPICVEDRPISATHGAGKEEARCASRLP